MTAVHRIHAEQGWDHRSFCTFLGVALPCAAIFLSAALPTAHADDAVAKEYAVKAAFLVNFAQFVDWPEGVVGQDEQIVIGVVGRDPFGGSLDAIVATKNAKEKRYAVQRYKGVNDLGPCHILFITPKEEQPVLEIIKALEDRPVLTVGETEVFARCGGIINFIVDRDRVRFEINQASAEKAQLRISAKLLRLQKRASP